MPVRYLGICCLIAVTSGCLRFGFDGLAAADGGPTSDVSNADLDSSGKTLAITFGESARPVSLAIDAQNSVVTGGDFDGELVVGPFLTSRPSGSRAAFACEFDVTGAPRWLVTDTGPGETAVIDVVLSGPIAILNFRVQDQAMIAGVPYSFDSPTHLVLAIDRNTGGVLWGSRISSAAGVTVRITGTEPSHGLSSHIIFAAAFTDALSLLTVGGVGGTTSPGPSLGGGRLLVQNGDLVGPIHIIATSGGNVMPQRLRASVGPTHLLVVTFDGGVTFPFRTISGSGSAVIAANAANGMVSRVAGAGSLSGGSFTLVDAVSLGVQGALAVGFIRGVFALGTEQFMSSDSDDADGIIAYLNAAGFADPPAVQLCTGVNNAALRGIVEHADGYLTIGQFDLSCMEDGGVFQTNGGTASAVVKLTSEGHVGAITVVDSETSAVTAVNAIASNGALFAIAGTIEAPVSYKGATATPVGQTTGTVWISNQTP